MVRWVRGLNRYSAKVLTVKGPKVRILLLPQKDKFIDMLGW